MSKDYRISVFSQGAYGPVVRSRLLLSPERLKPSVPRRFFMEAGLLEME